jgi:multicomponent K+:H+ antiporter subunit G
MIVFEALAAFLIVAGAGFVLVGSIGLAKLPDLMRRTHAPTKATTLGVGAMLIGSMLVFALGGVFSVHELLISLFLFLTAPVSAQMIGKAFILRQPRLGASLPPPGGGADWSTLKAPDASEKAP